MSDAFLNACRHAIGAPYVLTAEAEMAQFLCDQRRRFTGSALAVLRPANTQEVATLVKLCQQYRVPIVPQGGNTGLVLGSVPDTSGKAIVLSLLRLRTVRQIDRYNNTMCVEAGCLLAEVQQAAHDAERLFPLSLASEGSCSIGGNLATNAGGTAVLRYGNMRELCLGLEVVTAEGEIWDGLRGLRKDNTGYDLRDLFIGAEGTLGIITAAVLKLFPQPKAELTCIAALDSHQAALDLLQLAQNLCAANLTGFELMSAACLRLVAKHFPAMQPPFASFTHPQYVLLEIVSHESEQHASQLMQALFSQAIENGCVQDAVQASTLAQARTLWQWREHISPAQAQEGKNIKHDIALPISRIGDFLQHTNAALEQAFPGCRLICFGHLGDGNLHYNVAAPQANQSEEFLQNQDAVNQLVHDSVHQYGGSISAEHGIGALKRDQLPRYKSSVEIKLMQQIKQALDPHFLMNPGKVLNHENIPTVV